MCVNYYCLIFRTFKTLNFIAAKLNWFTVLFMSDILESSAVITVKKTFYQFAKFYGF